MSGYFKSSSRRKSGTILALSTMQRNPRTLVGPESGLRHWLSRPSRWFQTLIVIVAGCALFWWIEELSGGFQIGDADASIYTSLMVAHGHWSCMYRQVPSYQPLSGPIYPVVSAIIQMLSHVGFSSSFPSSTQIGANCAHAFTSFFAWQGSSAEFPWVLRTALIAWIALTALGIAVLRTTQLRGTRAVWLVPAFFAVTPPIIMALQEYYHPQDMWALAMTFAAVALWIRKRSFLAGIFLALAVMSQQYVLLGVVALIVVSSSRERRGLICGGVLATFVTATTMYLVAGSRALSATLLGTGDTNIHVGTWMSEIHLRSGAAIGLSRVGPLLAAAYISRWCFLRRPDLLKDPVVVLGLLATCWSLRLVFEENLWGYYCFATGATLVLRDIAATRLSRGTIAWLVLVLVVFGDFRLHQPPWGYWPIWVSQLLVAPSAFIVAFHSLRQSMRQSRDEPVAADFLSPN